MVLCIFLHNHYHQHHHSWYPYELSQLSEKSRVYSLIWSSQLFDSNKGKYQSTHYLDEGSKA